MFWYVPLFCREGDLGLPVCRARDCNIFLSARRLRHADRETSDEKCWLIQTGYATERQLHRAGSQPETKRPSFQKLRCLSKVAMTFKSCEALQTFRVAHNLLGQVAGVGRGLLVHELDPLRRASRLLPFQENAAPRECLVPRS